MKKEEKYTKKELKLLIFTVQFQVSTPRAVGSRLSTRSYGGTYQ